MKRSLDWKRPLSAALVCTLAYSSATAVSLSPWLESAAPAPASAEKHPVAPAVRRVAAPERRVEPAAPAPVESLEAEVESSVADAVSAIEAEIEAAVQVEVASRPAPRVQESHRTSEVRTRRRRVRRQPRSRMAKIPGNWVESSQEPAPSRVTRSTSQVEVIYGKPVNYQPQARVRRRTGGEPFRPGNYVHPSVRNRNRSSRRSVTPTYVAKRMGQPAGSTIPRLKNRARAFNTPGRNGYGASYVTGGYGSYRSGSSRRGGGLTYRTGGGFRGGVMICRNIRR